MTVWQRLRDYFGIGWGGVSANNFRSSIAWSYGLDDTYADTTITPYSQSATVANAISTIAADAASIEWELFPAGADDDERADQQIESDPLLDLLAKPNAYMNGSQFKVGSYISYKLWGECVWYYPNLIMGRSGGPRALFRNAGTIELLDPRALMLDFDDDGNPKWSIRRDGQDVALDPNSLTLFKRFNPYNPWRGLSELAAIMVEVQGDYAAAVWNRNYFSDQNGVPAGLLIPNEGSAISRDDREQLERKFNSKHGKMRRAVGMIPPGWKWEDLGVSQRDMDFRALREYSREQILATLGLPPFYAGVLDKANYANAREQKDVYWNGTITRLMADFQATFNSDFLVKIGRTDVEMYPCWEDVRALLEDLNEKADVAKKFFDMGFTRAQINERLQLGFDITENEDADVGYLPMSTTTVELVNEGVRPGQTQPDPEAIPLVDPIPGSPQPGTPQAAAPKPAAKPPKGYKRLPPLHDPAVQRHKRRVATWHSLDQKTRDLEVRFTAAVRKNFAAIEKEVLANLAGLKGWSISRGVLKAAGDNLFDTDEAKKKLQQATAPIYEEAIRRGMDTALAESGIEITLPISSPLAQLELAKLTQKITRITDTVERDLRDSLVDGVAAGESPQQLAARVKAVMEASDSRALTIARTETGQAFQTSRFATMSQAGVSQIEWLTAKDDRVRDSHAAIDGETTYIGTPFHNGLMYPLDPSAPPEEVINCRCVAVPVIDKTA